MNFDKNGVIRCGLCNSRIYAGRCTLAECVNAKPVSAAVQVPEYVSSETVNGDEDSRINLSFNIRVF